MKRGDKEGAQSLGGGEADFHWLAGVAPSVRFCVWLEYACSDITGVEATVLAGVRSICSIASGATDVIIQFRIVGKAIGMQILYRYRR